VINTTYLIRQILNIEWDMFRRVKSETPASCQNSPESFKSIRGSIFESWTPDMLSSYLEDLIAAQDAGRNLITEKYARMDNRIPCLNTNPLIDVIVHIEAAWQEDIKFRFPALYQRVCRSTDEADDGSNFSVYLRSELETYGHHTLTLYFQHLNQSWESGENPAMKALENLVRKGGYRDMDHAESQLAGLLEP
jgi:hypothetical protein